MILKSKNYTHLEFLQKISPDCQSQLIRCKLHDHIRPCRELFQRIETENGFCCSFIYDENLLGKDTKGQTMSFGYRWGLTILLDPQVEDYYASRSKLAGFQIFSHETADRISMDYPHQMVFARNEIDIRVTTSLTYAIPYVRRYDVDMRRCYFNNERKLLTFSNYTQYTCFLDCRSRQMLATCGCVPPLWSRTSNWSICTLTQASCVKANMERIMRTINHVHRDVEPYKSNPNSERYICQCYPNCNLYIYNTYYDVTPLERNFSMNDMEFFSGVELKNHLMVHVFVSDMSGEHTRLDVYYQWQNNFGLFGGITSLYMGCSFISILEIFFFLFVRPLCNWLARRRPRRQVGHNNNLKWAGKRKPKIAISSIA
ncbi:pickpocket protein 11 isoform X2 [Ceratitis capitata]|nr:pickpocket protein 11 isoform X2 [Ceratitis capitata]XP_020716190.1 pickpocket protein 11 isoform X2 [Ceratitis capitata]